ncbi:MAG: type II toxin-antitoxin system VapC family toxin [Xanthobacteraceae bacterium]|jgi:predicted nucleic acid-binding protein
MIVLDTNVISEMMRSRPDEAVAHWYRRLSRRALFTTSINCGEVFVGIETMAIGRKRAELAKEARAMFNTEFEGRVLSFDQRAAEHYADIFARRRRHGRPIDALDAQIAAIARAHGMGVATRNTKHFEDCGIDIINPWGD